MRYFTPFAAATYFGYVLAATITETTTVTVISCEATPSSCLGESPNCPASVSIQPSIPGAETSILPAEQTTNTPTGSLATSGIISSPGETDIPGSSISSPENISPAVPENVPSSENAPLAVSTSEYPSSGNISPSSPTSDLSSTINLPLIATETPTETSPTSNSGQLTVTESLSLLTSPATQPQGANSTFFPGSSGSLAQSTLSPLSPTSLSSIEASSSFSGSGSSSTESPTNTNSAGYLTIPGLSIAIIVMSVLVFA